MSTRGIAKSAVVFVLGAVAVLAVALYSPAGPLDPTAPPAGTMHTLNEIYANTASVVVPPEILARPRGKAYLQIQGVLGESTDAAHKDWIDIFGISYGEKNTVIVGGGGGGTAGRVNFSDLTVVKELDLSSPKLALACGTGKPYPELLIQCMMPDAVKPQRYYEIKLTDVIVTGVTPKMVYRGNGFVFMEEVAFNFSRIEWTYYYIDESGSLRTQVRTYWDVALNKGG